MRGHLSEHTFNSADHLPENTLIGDVLDVIASGISLLTNPKK